MPQVLESCVEALKEKGYSEHTAYAICVQRTGWKRKVGGGWTKRKKSK